MLPDLFGAVSSQQALGGADLYTAMEYYIFREVKQQSAVHAAKMPVQTRKDKKKIVLLKNALILPVLSYYHVKCFNILFAPHHKIGSWAMQLSMSALSADINLKINLISNSVYYFS